MATHTTFVLVPGAWHPSSCLDPLASRLSASGYTVRSVDLASVGAEPPLESFDPDVELIRNAIVEEADKGQDVVVFMHSYGGLVGGEACQGVDKKGREAAGQKGGVVGLIYCCAFMVPEGVGLFDSLGKHLPPWVIESDNGTRLDVVKPEEVFYNDLTAEHASEVAKVIKQQSFRSLLSKTTYPAYRDIPTTYVLCTKDNAIPIAVQEGMVAQAKQSGGNIETVRLESSHSPFCSMPDKLAEACRESVERLM